MKKHTFLRAVLTALLAVLFVLTPLSACKRSDSGSSTAKYNHVYKQTSIELPEEMTNVDTLYYRDGTLFDETMKNIVRKIAIADALAEENQQQLRSLGRSEVPQQVGLF